MDGTRHTNCRLFKIGQFQNIHTGYAAGMSTAIRVPFIRISPVTLTCPQCGANPGQPCSMLKGDVELVHVARITTAAKMATVRAKNP